ncbi:Protein NCA1 [Vitis vinifera]|uniref:Protein NCA1 n=1 Tax=Vitis vinifera TaxID=29760 RepID=A0A438EBG0_VITVI|nr:Protein NCA1 [Vitis vinifera]
MGRVCGDVENMVFWNKTKSGKFLVKSLYYALELGSSSSFPSSCIWNVWVQLKISFFAWEATWGKSLTLDLIQKRGWALILDVAVSLAKVADVNRNVGNEDVAINGFEEAIKLLESLTLSSEEAGLEQRYYICMQRLSVMEFLNKQIAEKTT